MLLKFRWRWKDIPAGTPIGTGRQDSFFECRIR